MAETVTKLTGLPQPVQQRVSFELATLLLSDPYSWRERRVETIVALDANHYRNKISLQFTIHAHQVIRALASVAAREAHDDLRKQLVDLTTAAWEGQLLHVPIPVFTLPKEVLLNPDLEDARGDRIRLENRFDNSQFAGAYLARILRTAVREVRDLALPSRAQQQLLRTLAFSMPEGLFHTSHLAPDALTSDDTRQQSLEVREFLEGYGIAVDDDDLAAVEGIIRCAVECQQLLTSQFAWKRIHGTRDPLLNPLLLFPDYLKLRTEGGRLELDSHREFKNFLASSQNFVNELATILRHIREARQRSPKMKSARAEHAIATLTRFTHSWVALAYMEIRVGTPQLAKLDSTVLLNEDRHFRGIHQLMHLYRVPIGDARSTHIEVSSPDVGTLEFAPGGTAVIVARQFSVADPEGVRLVFGYEHTTSRDLIAFYTTKTSNELENVIGRMRDTYANEQIDPFFVSDFEEVGLTVTYRLRGTLAALYFGTAVASLVTVLALIFRFTEVTQGAGAILTAAIALLAGILAQREKALAAHVMTHIRRLLLVAFLILMGSLLVALFVVPGPSESAQPCCHIQPSRSGAAFKNG